MNISILSRLHKRPFFIKLLHWEYWPFAVVYMPIYFYWFWICLKARSLFFFNAANPTIKNGGFLMESKKEIYDILLPEWYPKTILISKESSVEMVKAAIQNGILAFPLIGKPDIGMRGLSVNKLHNWEEVCAYTKQSKVDFLLQEFVPYQNEVGIFYYRYPNELNGHISGIVGKEFLSVVGDGVSTIHDLIMKSERAILQLSALKDVVGDKFSTILLKGEKFLLVPYGNHSRGAKFLDFSQLINEQFTESFDTICKQIPGFYFGRLDIRYKNWEDLLLGKNFSIIELNGAGSEPTHMYDPKHTLFFAWKEICRHLTILYTISVMNHNRHGVPYLRFTEGIKMFKDNAAYVKMIQQGSNSV